MLVKTIKVMIDESKIERKENKKLLMVRIKFTYLSMLIFWHSTAFVISP